MSTYVVGDIQGCYSALRRLLDSVEFTPQHDTLWAVGDLIGRGPESLQTIQYLHGLGPRFNSVLGNHDLHFLAVYAGIKRNKAADKFESLLGSSYCDEYVDWLRHKPLAICLRPDILLTHAGLYPQWSIAEALVYSQWVEQALRSQAWSDVLANMYGNQPALWQTDLPEQSRLRFIINAFTRMRFIQHQAQLEFSHKGPADSAPNNLHPWFQLPNPKLASSERIIFGHWAALNGQTGSSQFVGLDTGYIWGQKLTLWHLETDTRQSVGP